MRIFIQSPSSIFEYTGEKIEASDLQVELEAIRKGSTVSIITN